MNWKRFFSLGIVLLSLIAFVSCQKDPVESPNLLLGTWERDYTQFKGPNGEVYEHRWDNNVVVTFKETSATMVYDNSSTIIFGYYYENGVLHYNNVYADLSYDGESATVLNLSNSEMRLLFRGETTPWEETINAGKPDEKKMQVVSEIDVYKRK
ncbi:MAG: hypothetical protein II660_03800 [Bacteroidales bacterium]|nr:hypothetical protein [Bacteroidales bacterium]MBQ4189092.1 hypothetical protein [Bacteroidales bacterium]